MGFIEQKYEDLEKNIFIVLKRFKENWQSRNENRYR